MDKEQHNKTGARSILFVHGRDFKPASEPLMDISVAALRAGVHRDYPDSAHAFDGVFRDIAYYGDLTNELLRRHGRHYDEHLDLGDRNNALIALRSIPARKRFGIRQYDSLPGKSAVPEFIADIAAPTLGAIGLTLPMIGRVSYDFAEYLRGKTDYAELVRERVRSKLCDMLNRGDRVLLMSHGTGSVVAFEVLWQLSHDPRFKEDYGQTKLDLWLTLGAPLGNHSIRKRLLGAGDDSVASCPMNVISWHNVAAEDDYTCHDNTLADDFKKMLQQRVVSAVHDHHIYNLTVRYGKSNPHSSIGYYIHPRTAKIIVDWLQTEGPKADPKYIF